AGVAAHVADGVDGYQAANEGDHHQHDCRQTVRTESKRDIHASCVKPVHGGCFLDWVSGITSAHVVEYTQGKQARANGAEYARPMREFLQPFATKQDDHGAEQWQ